MGLAASQARLLTITSRKSQAQFDSMALSHQKLALSRNLTDISNEYQNSLNQTKLYYDFYGINSTDNPLTYSLLMSPSTINDYVPTLISNNQGNIVLSSPYARAAEAAGIPQEGLGCTPSSLMRNAFVMALAENGVITALTAESICGVTYNPGAGLGSDNLITETVVEGTYDDLLSMLSGVNYNGNYSLDGSMFAISANQGQVTVLTGAKNGDTIGNHTYKVLTGAGQFGVGDSDDDRILADGASTGGKTSVTEVTFADLLNGNQDILLAIQGTNDNSVAENYDDNYQALIDSVTNVQKALGNTLIDLLGGDDRVADAVAYADSQMQSQCWNPDKAANAGGGHSLANWIFTFGLVGIFGAHYVDEERNGWTISVPSGSGKESREDESYNKSLDNADGYMALINSYRTHKLFWPFATNSQENVGSIDLTTFTKAWFTYFMQYMEGLGSAKSNEWSITWRDKVENQRFATDSPDENFKFVFRTERVSDDEALVANFYDTLFNQLCVNGWTENNNVATDSKYLQEMIKSGMMYITSQSDDYYYYQNNYATNTFIKEVSDDAAIAAAESRYTTEKARINAKEEELDLKMKNLDTEISSLETEYEAVKKIIDNQASKCFTRYDS